MASAETPDATIHWFEHSGHLPQWDEPEAATRLILEWTGGPDVPIADAVDVHT